MELISLYIQVKDNIEKEFNSCKKYFRYFNLDGTKTNKSKIKKINKILKKYNHNIIDFYIYHYFDFKITYNERIYFEHSIGINYSMYYNCGHIISDFAKEHYKEWFNENVEKSVLDVSDNIYYYFLHEDRKYLKKEFLNKFESFNTIKNKRKYFKDIIRKIGKIWS
jgi:hypothetical protein